MLGTLTAARRAAAAESLMVCEQVYRTLLDQDYTRARRLLEMHSDLLPNSGEIDPSNSGSGISLVGGQVDQMHQGSDDGLEPPIPPI